MGGKVEGMIGSRRGSRRKKQVDAIEMRQNTKKVEEKKERKTPTNSVYYNSVNNYDSDTKAEGGGEEGGEERYNQGQPGSG